MSRLDCKHDRLARACTECEAEETIAALRAKLQAAEAQIRNERERLIALLRYEGTDAVCTEPEVHHDLKIVSMVMKRSCGG